MTLKRGQDGEGRGHRAVGQENLQHPGANVNKTFYVRNLRILAVFVPVKHF
jgi:hypothetical protein